MEPTRGSGKENGESGSTGYVDPTPVMPPWQRQVMLMFRADCLLGAAQELAKAGDTAMAIQMTVWAREAVKEAREIEERAKAQ